MKKLSFFSLLIILTTFVSCKNSAGTSNNNAVRTHTNYQGGKAEAGAKAAINTTLDQQDRKIMDRTSPLTLERMDRGESLTVGDVIKLSQSGVSDEIIIHYMSETKTSYNLTQAQINRMQEAGVSQRVINTMIDTGK